MQNAACMRGGDYQSFDSLSAQLMPSGVLGLAKVGLAKVGLGCEGSAGLPADCRARFGASGAAVEAAAAAAAAATAAPLGKPTCTLLTLTGVTGRSFCVGTCEIATMTLKLSSSMHLPNTGCLLSPGVYQFRTLLSLTFMKSCEPPEFGAPVFAIASVPASFRILTVNSSGIVPPVPREIMLPSRRFVKLDSSVGPPVPARGSSGSLAYGHPNCTINDGMTR